MDKTDAEIFRKAKPYLRSAIALIVFLRFGAGISMNVDDDSVERVHDYADLFIAQLQAAVHEKE